MSPVQRAALRFCLLQGWAALPEAVLPEGLRADLWVLRPDGRFLILEAKSGPRDILADRKWPRYRAFCDRLYFAVDPAFPPALLPQGVGVIVAEGAAGCLLREAPDHPLPPARRRALLQRFALAAGRRLAALTDPDGLQEARAALRAE
ncbi:MAG: MmcB family DNA repair protein [Roseococcus sp.]|nr:MmcB family DNA repair protein [Roseococcus sp.]